jgi:hypothetical protein
VRKTIAAVGAAVALTLPATPVGASDIPQPVGAKRCPPGYVGVILWVNTAPTGYHEEPFCIHVGP